MFFFWGKRVIYFSSSLHYRTISGMRNVSCDPQIQLKLRFAQLWIASVVGACVLIGHDIVEAHALGAPATRG